MPPNPKWIINLNKSPAPVDSFIMTNGLLNVTVINVVSEDKTPRIPQNPQDYSQTLTLYIASCLEFILDVEVWTVV